MSDEPKHEQTADEPIDDLEVTAEQADEVKGGDAIVSPRDPASGLPTGKRTYHPLGG